MARNWPEPLDGLSWMRQQERRQQHMERMPTVRSAADLLGPGLAAQAVRIMDWNEDATLFNGFFYSAPGAINSPDGALWWMGESLGTPDGYGYQRVVNFRNGVSPPLALVRTFSTTTGLRVFTDWQPENPFWSTTGTIQHITTTTVEDLGSMTLDIPVPSPAAVFMVTINAQLAHYGATTETVTLELWVNGVKDPVEINVTCPLDGFRTVATKRYPVTGVAAGLREFKVTGRLSAVGDWAIGDNSVLLVERTT